MNLYNASLVFGANIVMVVGIGDWLDYDHDKKRIGVVYKCLNISNGTVQSVKVPGDPIVTAKQVADACEAFAPLLIEFDGFEARAYSAKGSSVISFTCTAEEASIVVRGDI